MPESYEHNSEKFGTIDLGGLAGVQTALGYLDCDAGNADGIDGPKTQAAVRKFQKEAMIKVDGIVGPETREALLNALDQLAAYDETGESREESTS